MIHSVKTEILMNISPQETRVATIENGQLQEIHVERQKTRGIVGNIYKGVVLRVLPGMQAAFIDIGIERAGFIHVKDIMAMKESPGEDLDLAASQAEIRNFLHEGQEVLVQVIRDPLGTKGARLTAHLSVAARYLVYMPDLQHVGVSLRLEDEQERTRLQDSIGRVLDVNDPKGYIVRTVAEGASDEDLQYDIKFLNKLWGSVQEQIHQAVAPCIVHEELPLIKRILRDMVTYNVERIRVDCPQTYEVLREFLNKYIPYAVSKIDYYNGHTPIFEMYAVEDELQKALRRKVSLKSGGYIVIDQTEAMTTIDVNTGAFVGSRNLEETIFKTNLESVQTIARQLRLRNLGGIIILDFIDMLDQEHKDQLYASLSKALQKDPAKTQICQISSLGLVEMTRKRTHDSLMRQLCETCPQCDGRGVVKSMHTICYEIYREIIRESQLYDDAEGFIVVGSKEVIDYLMEDESHNFGELEASIQQTIQLQAEPNYMQEQYDIILI